MRQAGAHYAGSIMWRHLSVSQMISTDCSMCNLSFALDAGAATAGEPTCDLALCSACQAAWAAALAVATSTSRASFSAGLQSEGG